MNEFVIYFSSLISLTLLAIFIFWLYEDYCIDVFRQNMFQLRDEWFDEARQGRIDFNDDTYGMLRIAMNGMIRFGHKLNLTQVLLMILITKKNNYQIPSFFKRLSANMENYSDDQQKMIISYYERMNFYAVEHLFWSSILMLLTIVCPLLFLWKAKQGMSKVVCYFRGPLDKIDSAALTTGKYITQT